MTITDCLDDGAARADRPAAQIASEVLVQKVEAGAVALHTLNRLRARHFVSRVMADPAMNLMLTLVISECQNMTASEQSILLANQIAPLEGATLLDTLVHAGLVVVTGTMPGRRSVGLSPLGSARMRAYILDSLDLV